MIDRPPHQAEHQDVQPAALQQVDLVCETQLDEAWKTRHTEKYNDTFTGAGNIFALRIKRKNSPENE